MSHPNSSPPLSVTHFWGRLNSLHSTGTKRWRRKTQRQPLISAPPMQGSLTFTLISLSNDICVIWSQACISMSRYSFFVILEKLCPHSKSSRISKHTLNEQHHLEPSLCKGSCRYTERVLVKGCIPAQQLGCGLAWAGIFKAD